MQNLSEITAYGHLSAELYSGENRQAIFDGYLRTWQDKSLPVLSAMCGTGDFLIRFAEQGADIDGIDASEHMLNILKRRCKEKDLTPNVYHQLLQELSLPRKYGYVFMPDRCFGLVANKDHALQSLKLIWDHMLPGGKLVLDLRQPQPNHDDSDIPRKWHQNRPDGTKLYGTNVVSYEEEGHIWRIIGKKELKKDDQLIEAETLDYRERFYQKDEFLDLLKQANFQTVETRYAFDCKDPQEGFG